MDRLVTISWPNCTNITETKKNYQTTFTCVSYLIGAIRGMADRSVQKYDAETINQILQLEMEDVSGHSAHLVFDSLINN